MYTLQTADLNKPDFIALIDTHADLMQSLSPPGSCHFLPLEGLRKPSVDVWEIRNADELLACGALQELSANHGEIKCMHTFAKARGRGLSKMMLAHIMTIATERGYKRLSLETGVQPGFEPARQLYLTHGFKTCPPFGDYKEDPNSVFMTKII